MSNRDSLKKVREDFDSRFNRLEDMLEQILESRIDRTVQPETVAKVEKAQAEYKPRTIGDLSEVSPKVLDKIDADKLVARVEATDQWRKRNGLPEGSMAVYVYRNKSGKYNVWGGKLESKAPSNAVGIAHVC